MLALLEKERPDIVHFHNIYHQLTPALIKVARNFGCKTVLTAHDYKIVCPAYSMLRDGKVCDSCITGTVFNAFRYRCQEGSASKSLLLSPEATRAVHCTKLSGTGCDCFTKRFYAVFCCARCQIRALMSSSMALMIAVPRPK